MKKIALTIAVTVVALSLNAQNFMWAKGMGCANVDDEGMAITTDALGNIYTTGYFSGTVDFDPGPGVFTITPVSGSIDVFISKLDASGNFVWAKSLGGFNQDVGTSISVDASGNVYTA